MTCKDCIHFEICQIFSDQYGISKVYPSECGYAKDRSRLVELPCKVGDKIYMIAGDGDEAFVAEGRVKSVIFESECVWMYARYDCGLTYHHPVGTDDYFFTKEEAEKKLEEMKR